MRWVRRSNRIGSWAALFALALQLVVSFGHFHLSGFHASSPGVATQLQPQANGAASTDPADDDNPVGSGYCAICAVLNLTSSSALPTVALPATPVDHPHKWIVDLRPAGFLSGPFSFSGPRTSLLHLSND
jgi:hypothetical protein